MSKGSLLGGALIVGILFAACSPDDNEATPAAAPAAPTTSTSAAPTYSYSPSIDPAAGPVTATPPVTGETVTVTRVIDGDTFETSDGRKVGVLGIDSCEIGTYGGAQAKTAAEGQLTNTYNQPITLSSEPGVDTDKDGRQLRYVQLGSTATDFGEYMVKYDHTGVYQGKYDASSEYLERLYAADTEYSANPPSGRECADPYPTTSSSDGGSSYSYDSDDSYNMPDGALTGGYCARKWWC